MYAGGEDLHVAIWPGGVGLTKDITRFIAREGRVFVLSAADLHSAEDIPIRSRSPTPSGGMRDETYEDGGSCIAGPDGEWVVAPVANDERLVAPTSTWHVSARNARTSTRPATTRGRTSSS